MRTRTIAPCAASPAATCSASGSSPRARAAIDYEAATERVGDGWDRDGHEPLLRALEPVAAELVEVAGDRAPA